MFDHQLLHSICFHAMSQPVFCGHCFTRARIVLPVGFIASVSTSTQPHNQCQVSAVSPMPRIFDASCATISSFRFKLGADKWVSPTWFLCVCVCDAVLCYL